MITIANHFQTHINSEANFISSTVSFGLSVVITMKFFVKVLLFLSIFNICSCVIVQTQHGPVEGRTRMSDLGRTYFSFMGIPYAKPPEGALKFRVRKFCENLFEFDYFKFDFEGSRTARILDGTT